METWLLVFIICYVSLGTGFALSSWLQALENRLHKQFIPRDYVEEIKTFVFFTLGWWVIAIYCYKAEISKTIPTLKEYAEKNQDKI